MVKKIEKPNRSLREENLRRRIKAVLQTNQKPEERLSDKCGPVEFGLDLVILKLDPFGHLRACGIQIKTGDITCSRNKPNKTIKEIIGQLAIAFGKPVEIDGKTYRLDGFYVITDGEINNFAQQYVTSACQGIRNLHFMDGQALKEFFAKYEYEVFKFEET